MNVEIVIDQEKLMKIADIQEVFFPTLEDDQALLEKHLRSKHNDLIKKNNSKTRRLAIQ